MLSLTCLLGPLWGTQDMMTPLFPTSRTLALPHHPQSHPPAPTQALLTAQPRAEQEAVFVQGWLAQETDGVTASGR